jgi:NADH-quinone oxidoreductase subunit M
MLIPLVGALVIAASPARQAKWIGLTWSILAFGVSVFAAFQFDWGHSGAFQFTAEFPFLPSVGVTLSLGADGVAMLLVLLTAMLGPLCVLGSFTAIQTRVKSYYGWLLVLQCFLTGVFVSRDMILFYLSFEFTLAPMFVLISLWGSTNRRAAANKFFLFTFTGSVLALAGFVYVAAVAAQAHGGVWSFQIDDLQRAAQSMSASEQGWVLLALLAGFAVKVPIFPVHTWLPLAHTEAPTAGSVILAGVMLKLGTYAIFRFILPFVPIAVAEYAQIIAVFAIIGVLYTGLICWVQTDVKKLVAYSSVSHLGFCILGLVALNMVGGAGSVMYMINHGLSTGALFFCIGMIYERYHTRSMDELGGLAKRMPVWAFFMVFFTLASVGLPGLNGFVSEFMTLFGAFQSGAGGVGGTSGPLGPWFAAVAAVGMVVAAMYLLYMVGKVVFGPLREPDNHHAHEVLPTDLNAREIAVLAPIAVMCIVLGVYPTPVLRALEAPVSNTIAAAVEANENLQLVKQQNAGSPETVAVLVQEAPTP